MGDETPSAGARARSAESLARKLSLDDIDVAGRRVLVRADFNVPVLDGEVTDDTRIVGTLPTLRRLLAAGARVVVMSHRGRPGGQADPAYSMAPVAACLAAKLGQEVALAPDCVGERTREMADAVRPGGILLLENLRFHPEETGNELAFATELAELADVYVNDAFGVSHRAHASVEAVAGIVPAAVAGELLRLEVTMLSRALLEPAKPFLMILGGAKVSDKVALIGNVLPLVDQIMIGGAMANAFLAARGVEIGGSLAPPDAIEEAREVIAEAEGAGVELLLPVDLVAASALDAPESAHVVASVAGDEMALDIGPETRERFTAAVAAARTIVWNGPMGVFETPEFAAGTRAVAAAVAALGEGAFTVIGGGDTAAAAAQFGIADAVTHVSTGGGASLDLLSGAVLPGVAALSDRETNEEVIVDE